MNDLVKIEKKNLGTVEHICHPSIQEAEAGGSPQVGRQPDRVPG